MSGSSVTALIPAIAPSSSNITASRPSSMVNNNSNINNSNTTNTSNTSQSVKQFVSFDEWQKLLSNISLSKSECNQIILEFLIKEGFKDAAEAFSKESNIQYPIEIDDEEFSIRQAIKSIIYNGNVKEAIRLLNSYDSEILDTHQFLMFKLKQLEFIEMIKSNQMEEAIKFAQEQLGPRAELFPELVDDLEDTMCLLLYEEGWQNKIPTDSQGNKKKNSMIEQLMPLHLLDPQFRIKVAKLINDALWDKERSWKDLEPKEYKLEFTLNMLKGRQETLSKLMEFPMIKNPIKGFE